MASKMSALLRHAIMGDTAYPMSEEGAYDDLLVLWLRHPICGGGGVSALRGAVERA
ncbi:MAG: hypothetical protein OJF49_003282 [Ktedonobacterales bacterium]|jgi:hypothetical protein|nr:MAG: hypothetical protein OJF49_003282 [Ktedonobacterales bacterium]